MENSLRFDAVVPLPFGHMAVRLAVDALEELIYVPESIKVQAPRCALAREVARQIRAYVADPRFVFDLPLAERGTSFQRSVWQSIRKVPAGSTCTYAQIARLVRSAPRAVGQACGANWYSLVIPCHRVVAARGIGGFGRHDGDGFHMDIKRWLLRHEGSLPGA